MSSAPFPSEQTGLPQVRSAIPIPERGHYIPADYAASPHPDPAAIRVTQKGAPILSFGTAFTVADVAPERRWAIGRDGEVMDPLAFKSAYQQYILGYYAMLRAQGRDARFEGNIERESVPEVGRFVSFGVDPEDSSKLRQIGYDPYRTKGAKPATLMDAKGENPRPRLQALVDAYRVNPLSLTVKEREEVEEHLGVKSGGGDLSAKLSMLHALKADGTLTQEQHDAKVAELTGEVPIVGKPEKAPKPKKKRAAPTVVAACGETIYAIHKHKHPKSCTRCQEIAAKG